MRLPETTVVSEEKLTHYLLVPQARGDKSRFLALAGYTPEHANRLMHDLREQLLLDATPTKANKFGQLVGYHEVRYTATRQTEKRMKFDLYRDVVLARDLPEDRLKRGDILKLVDHHVADDGEAGYSAEVLNALGETLTIVTVPESALEALREDESLLRALFRIAGLCEPRPGSL